MNAQHIPDHREHNLLDHLQELIELTKSNYGNWRPIDEHEKFRFKQDYGPALGRIGQYVIYSDADAREIARAAEVLREIKFRLSYPS